MNVFVCLPCYNEERSLPSLLDRFGELFATREESFQLIAVNDGSVDGTAGVLERYGERLSLRVVTHEVNLGLGPGIMNGFRAALEAATGDDDVVICLDADDTHDPKYIPEMLRLVAEGADVVIASRFQQGSEEVGVSTFRRFLSRGARALFRLTLPIPGVLDYTCGYRAYRVGVLRKAFEFYGNKLIERRGFACTDEVLVKLSVLTDRIRETPFILRYDLKQTASALPLMTTIFATLRLIQRGRVLRKQGLERLRDGSTDSD